MIGHGYYGSLIRSHRYSIDLMTLSDHERLPIFFRLISARM